MYNYFILIFALAFAGCSSNNAINSELLNYLKAIEKGAAEIEVKRNGARDYSITINDSSIANDYQYSDMLFKYITYCMVVECKIPVERLSITRKFLNENNLLEPDYTQTIDRPSVDAFVSEVNENKSQVIFILGQFRDRYFGVYDGVMSVLRKSYDWYDYDGTSFQLINGFMTDLKDGDQKLFVGSIGQILSGTNQQEELNPIRSIWEKKGFDTALLAQSSSK